jgi:hypothetical protein
MTLSPVLLKTGSSPDSSGKLSSPEPPNSPMQCAEDDELTQEIFYGIKKHIDEDYIRKAIYLYIEKFVDMVFRFEPSKVLQSVGGHWMNRVEGWMNTLGYKSLVKVRFLLQGDNNYRLVLVNRFSLNQIFDPWFNNLTPQLIARLIMI